MKFFEVSRREHRDGAITGVIQRFDGEYCTKAGTFRIEPDGSIRRAPKVLKDVPALILYVDGSPQVWKGTTTPTDDDLRTHIKGKHVEQYLAGGVNAHIATILGRIPYPLKAEIVNLDTGATVATWQAATFECW
jgi:hypothetical protein